MTAERNIYKMTAIHLIDFKNLLGRNGNRMKQGFECVAHLTLGRKGSILFFVKVLINYHNRTIRLIRINNLPAVSVLTLKYPCFSLTCYQ
jgi:hypothetical protein